MPVYAFMVGIIGTGLFGFAKALTGNLGQAESAKFTLVPEAGQEQVVGIAAAFLLLRAFSSGCAALTGVEAISNGVPAFENRHLRTERDPKARARMMRSRVINALGAFMSGTVLIVVLVTKFLEGARYAILAMAILFVLMLGIKRHYSRVSEELRLDEDDSQLLPSRVHAIVLLSKLHKPAMRALAYARATRPTFLEAITVEVEPEDTAALREEWSRREIPVPLKVLASPYREITRPIIDYVRSLRSGNPRDVVVVYIPEYVLGRWYEQILHNQSALRLKARLLFTPGVMVASVPWQLRSSEGQEDEDDLYGGPSVGSVRRGPS